MLKNNYTFGRQLSLPYDMQSKVHSFPRIVSSRQITEVCIITIPNKMNFLWSMYYDHSLPHNALLGKLSE